MLYKVTQFVLIGLLGLGVMGVSNPKPKVHPTRIEVVTCKANHDPRRCAAETKRNCLWLPKIKACVPR